LDAAKSGRVLASHNEKGRAQRRKTFFGSMRLNRRGRAVLPELRSIASRIAWPGEVSPVSLPETSIIEEFGEQFGRAERAGFQYIENRLLVTTNSLARNQPVYADSLPLIEVGTEEE
jgi:hypothetical protein